MTAANFCIVLNDSLPPPNIAGELLKQLPQYAPYLGAYLDLCQSSLQHIDSSESRCLATEYWQLHHCGFNPSTAKHNAALALLLASKQQKITNIEPHQPLWLVELVHIAPSREGAALIPSSELNLSIQHNELLLQSAQNLCEGTIFHLKPWSTTHWQLQSQIPLDPTFASSQLVSRTSVNDWWDQSENHRDWRRFVNELQMLYFNHPVNQERQEQGLVPINSLWPVGGINPDLWPDPQISSTQIIHTLSPFFLKQDWGGWLFALQELEQTLRPLLETKPTLVLTNTESLLVATPRTSRLWHKLFTPTSTWRNQWLAQS